MDHSHEINAQPRLPVWLIHGLRTSSRIVGHILEYIQGELRHRALDLAAWWQRQPWPTRLYSSGGIVMITSLASMLIGITYRELPQTLFIEGAILLAAGIVHEGYRITRWILSTVIGKTASALITTMIVAISMGISSVTLNDTTGFSPSDFPYTVAFLAPLTAGYIILLLIIAMFVIALLTITVFGLFSICKTLCTSSPRVEEESAKLLSRLMAAITLLVLVTHVWNEEQVSYEHGLTATASWFAYTFEMYGKDPCARNAHERVRRINPGQALIGSERDGQRVFFARECSPVIFP